MEGARRKIRHPPENFAASISQQSPCPLVAIGAVFVVVRQEAAEALPCRRIDEIVALRRNLRLLVRQAGGQAANANLSRDLLAAVVEIYDHGRNRIAGDVAYVSKVYEHRIARKPDATT
ncbi:hypothetical protein VWY34_08090 [Phaeobacter sp. JH20_02]